MAKKIIAAAAALATAQALGQAGAPTPTPAQEEPPLEPPLEPPVLPQPPPPDLTGLAAREAQPVQPTLDPEEKVDKTLPPPLASLKGTPMEAVVRVWHEEKRQLCSHPGCYYPVNPYMVEGKTIPVKGGGVVGICSWAGQAHPSMVYTAKLYRP